MSKYAEPWAAGLSELKHDLEEKTMEKVFEIYIKTTPERLWEAITDPEMREQVQLRRAASSPTGRPARSYEVGHPGRRSRSVEGENLEVDPPRRLVQSFNALWGDDVEGRGHLARDLGDRAGRGLVPADVVTHDQLREGANDQLYGGWPMILSGLKTLLETGELLTTPGSLMYAQTLLTAS